MSGKRAFDIASYLVRDNGPNCHVTDLVDLNDVRELARAYRELVLAQDTFLAERDALVRNEALEEAVRVVEMQAVGFDACRSLEGREAVAREFRNASVHIANVLRNFKSSPPQAEGADTT